MNEEQKVEREMEKEDEEMAEKCNEIKDEEHKTEDKEEDEGGKEKADECSEEKAEEIKEEKFDEGGEEKTEEIKEEKADEGGEEKADEDKPKENKEEGVSKKSRSRRTPDGKIKEKELKQEVEQRTPLTERPVRERKSVERLVAFIDKDANKEIHIEKGRGMPLKDILNVAYKLARRKPDDTFKLLHGILFGRKGKAFQIKGNLSRFSGFVWHDSEDKQRNKVKEKFDKCTKEKLLEVCDILDIPTSKATTKKEDIVEELIDILVAPHATTTVLLAEKETGKGQKRKRGMKWSSSTLRSGSSNRAAKSRAKGGDASKGGRKKTSSDSDEDSEDEKGDENENDHEKTENCAPEVSDHSNRSESEEESRSEDESDEDAGNKKKQRSCSKKQSSGKAKSKKIEESEKSSPPQKRSSSSKRLKVDDNSEATPTPRKKNESASKKSTTPAKSDSKEKSGRKAAKGKDKAKHEKAGPSIDELRDAICEILKEVDFNTATFTDILKKLAKQFVTDLTPRKSAIKVMIQEELTKLADEAYDDEEDADGGAGKDEMANNGTEVKA